MTETFEGRAIIRTNERVKGVGVHLAYTRRGAEKHLKKYPPLVPSYHYKIEKRGWFHFEVVPYQNILDPSQNAS